MIVGAMSLFGVVVTALMGAWQRTHSKEVIKHVVEINKAVNCRGDKDPTLYQISLDNREDIVKLGGRIEKVEGRIEHVSDKLIEHDAWERARHGRAVDKVVDSTDNLR